MTEPIISYNGQKHSVSEFNALENRDVLINQYVYSNIIIESVNNNSLILLNLEQGDYNFNPMFRFPKNLQSYYNTSNLTIKLISPNIANSKITITYVNNGFTMYWDKIICFFFNKYILSNSNLKQRNLISIIGSFALSGEYNLINKSLDFSNFLNNCKVLLYKNIEEVALATTYTNTPTCYMLELLGFELIDTFKNPNTNAILSYYCYDKKTVKNPFEVVQYKEG